MSARIGIYDRWLHVLGGGERYVCVLSQALSRSNQVTLLTHHPVPRDELERRLRVDLGGVSIRRVRFDERYRAVAARSESFDLFVNGSHRDLFPARARANALIVFFPAEPATAVAPLEYPIWLRPRRLLQRAWLVDGYHPPRVILGRVCRWTGACARIRVELPHRPPRSRLRLELGGIRPPDAPPARVRMEVDGRPVGDEWELPRDRFVSRTVAMPLLRPGRQTADLTISCDSTSSVEGVGPVGVALAGVWVESGIAGPLEGLLRRNRVLPTDAPAERLEATLASYQRLIAISDYSRRWMERLWNRSGEVLYPPVALDSDPSTARVPAILSVGRFFPGQHNKKHAEMIGAFRALVDGGLSGWEYHLVGGLKRSERAHREYVAELEEMARGYPIRLHVNATPRLLRELYRACTLFWHATGLGEDPESEPERFEHFGVSTVEAMAAGCVPLVFGEGGQTEIVQDGRNGIAWSSVPELCAATQHLVGDPPLAQRLGDAARRRAREFSDEAFAERALRLLEPMVVDRQAVARA